MRDIATALGYALTIAFAAVLFYAGFTAALELRSDPLAHVAAALCGAVSGLAAWPRTPAADALVRPRAAMEIGSRTAFWFYLLFTTATVVERFPEYFGEGHTVASLLVSLPGLVVVSVGAMIYATFGAAFFLSAFIAAGWVRLARRRAAPLSGTAPCAPAPPRA